MDLINIFDDLKNKVSIKDIIKKYKISLSRLIKIAKFHNNTSINYEDMIIKELYILRKQGKTYAEIGRVYNSTRISVKSYIEEYCSQNNLILPQIQKIDLPLKDIYNMRKNGISVDEISKKYNVSVGTIYDRLNEYCAEKKLEVPKLEFKKKKIDLPLKDIYNMRKNGISVDEISKKYNVSVGTIYNRLKEIYLENLLYLFQCIIDNGNNVSTNHFTEIENIKCNIKQK